jgi:hypothetical protein
MLYLNGIQNFMSKKIMAEFLILDKNKKKNMLASDKNSLHIIKQKKKGWNPYNHGDFAFIFLKFLLPVSNFTQCGKI